VVAGLLEGLPPFQFQIPELSAVQYLSQKSAKYSVRVIRL